MFRIKNPEEFKKKLDEVGHNDLIELFLGVEEDLDYLQAFTKVVLYTMDKEQQLNQNLIPADSVMMWLEDYSEVLFTVFSQIQKYIQNVGGVVNYETDSQDQENV